MIKITHLEKHKEELIAKKIFTFLRLLTDDSFEVKTNDGVKNNLVIKNKGYKENGIV